MSRLFTALVCLAFVACGVEPGADGTSCSVQQTDSGARLFCTDGTEADVLNGKDAGGIVARWQCLGKVGAMTAYEYVTAVTDDGGVWSSARLYGPATQVFTSHIYSPIEDSASLGRAVIVHDLGGEPTFGVVVFEFNYEQAQLTITYKDSEYGEDVTQQSSGDECKQVLGGSDA